MLAERKPRMRLEMNTEDNIWRAHIKTEYLSIEELRRITEGQIDKSTPTEILFLSPSGRIIRSRISYEELHEAKASGNKARERFVDTVVSDMLEYGRIIIQIPHLAKSRH